MRASDTAAIILGAGAGRRFGGRVRKQYLKLGARPILWWSLAAFNRCAAIGRLVLVVPADDIARVTRQVRQWRFEKLAHIVAGGQERSDSVKEGLKVLPSTIHWVAVHDGVRPLITPEQITAVLSAARRHRAAIAATPSRDTVKIADKKEFIRECPPRHSVWQAQTPQIFERALLERAHRLPHPVTDDAQLVERLGVRVKLVDATPENMKVTHPLDLQVAELIVKSRRR